MHCSRCDRRKSDGGRNDGGGRRRHSQRQGLQAGVRRRLLRHARPAGNGGQEVQPGSDLPHGPFRVQARFFCQLGFARLCVKRDRTYPDVCFESNFGSCKFGSCKIFIDKRKKTPL